MSDLLFGFDSSIGALVYLNPESGQPQAITCKTLRDLGWKADENEMRKSLPRVDPSPIQVARAMPPGFNGGRR